MNFVELSDAMHHIKRVKSMNPKLHGSCYELAVEFCKDSRNGLDYCLDTFLKSKLEKFKELSKVG